MLLRRYHKKEEPKTELKVEPPKEEVKKNGGSRKTKQAKKDD